jgi:predicted ribosome quality control (RQC) complex YloA/Tae2 family protein
VKWRMFQTMFTFECVYSELKNRFPRCRIDNMFTPPDTSKINGMACFQFLFKFVLVNLASKTLLNLILWPIFPIFSHDRFDSFYVDKDHHDITDILLRMALNTIILTSFIKNAQSYYCQSFPKHRLIWVS